MRIKQLKIQNYKSLKNVEINPSSILALVGRNNSGKSNVLKALELFFEPSTSLLNDESFHDYKTEDPITISVTFSDLTDWEKSEFKSYLIENEFSIEREFCCVDHNKYEISSYAIVRVPDKEWLQEENVNGTNIDQWWQNQQIINNEMPDFHEMLGSSKPQVGVWKEKIQEYISRNPDKVVFIDKKIKNPKGYSNVLKGALPEFIHIPAVRNVSDETKITKSNPFGDLINTMLSQIPIEKKEEFSASFQNLAKDFNKSDDTDDRLQEIKDLEKDLNVFMKELMDCDISLKIDLPQLEDLFKSTKIYIDDGIISSLESKGHGLQRSMIITILRLYAEHLKRIKVSDRASEKSLFLAIEEPELYLHPQLQRTLMDVIISIADKNNQIFYSTQSSLFVDVSRFDEICIMRRDEENGYWQSLPTTLTVNQMLEDLQDRTKISGTEEGLRELYQNAFNSIINEGFFADKVVIVEGSSEECSLPIYAELLDFDFDRNNIAIANAGGKGPIDRLWRIFNLFGIPTYTIFDGDKSTANTDNKRKTLELLEILEDPLSDFDHLTTKIEANYSVFEEKYEVVLESEITNYSDLIKEAADLMGSTGKPLRHKFIANSFRKRLAQGESDVNIPETIKEIIQKIRDL